MDSFDPALISVVMPCHNAAPFVEEAVGSLLGQNLSRVELIVVDDGSTDGANEILLGLAAAHPERITLIFQNRNGPVAARNRALAHANGNCIAFLDSDGTWQLDALSRMHAALETQTADIDIPSEFDASEAILHLLQQFPLADQRRANPPPSHRRTARGFRTRAHRHGGRPVAAYARPQAPAGALTRRAGVSAPTPTPAPQYTRPPMAASVRLSTQDAKSQSRPS